MFFEFLDISYYKGWLNKVATSIENMLTNHDLGHVYYDSMVWTHKMQIKAI